MTPVAVLFCDPRGVYASPALTRGGGAIPWGLPALDARSYAGPHPVVAHPPCERWGAYAAGGPSSPRGRFIPGNDGGCFASALAAARRWGGVVEHPRRSLAWTAHGLSAPRLGASWRPLDAGGWAVTIAQGPWGLDALKPTTLVAFRALDAGDGPGDDATPPPPLEAFCSPPPAAVLPSRLRGVEGLPRARRASTPAPLALALVRLARCLGGGAPPSTPPRPWPEWRSWEWGG